MSQIKRMDPDGMTFRSRVLVPLLNNRAGYWYLTTVAPKIDAWLTPVTRAWLSSVPGTPLLLITTTGARSGKPRTNPLVYWSRGHDVILMASNFGRDSHPSWLFNVKANPDVTLLFRGKRGPYRARLCRGLRVRRAVGEGQGLRRELPQLRAAARRQARHPRRGLFPARLTGSVHLPPGRSS